MFNRNNNVKKDNYKNNNLIIFKFYNNKQIYKFKKSKK